MCDVLQLFQVIVTICSPNQQELQVLVEIPSGSIPVTTNDYTRSYNVILDPYSTKLIEYFFYFPAVFSTFHQKALSQHFFYLKTIFPLNDKKKTGNFDIYPANVGKSGQILAVAKPCSFEVKAQRTVSNLETINEIFQRGSKEDILKYVATKNIRNTNIFKFETIYPLLRDKSFYIQFINILKLRKIFDEDTWRYSAYHHDYSTFVELLNSQNIK